MEHNYEIWSVGEPFKSKSTRSKALNCPNLTKKLFQHNHALKDHFFWGGEEGGKQLSHRVYINRKGLWPTLFLLFPLSFGLFRNGSEVKPLRQARPKHLASCRDRSFASPCHSAQHVSPFNVSFCSTCHSDKNVILLKVSLCSKCHSASTCHFAQHATLLNMSL